MTAEKTDRPSCRVEISAAGRQVTVESDGILPAVARKALELWRATGRTTPARAADTAGSVGFGLTDRAARAGLMSAEVDLPARIADREKDDDVDRHRRTGF